MDHYDLRMSDDHLLLLQAGPRKTRTQRRVDADSPSSEKAVCRKKSVPLMPSRWGRAVRGAALLICKSLLTFQIQHQFFVQNEQTSKLHHAVYPMPSIMLV